MSGRGVAGNARFLFDSPQESDQLAVSSNNSLLSRLEPALGSIGESIKHTYYGYMQRS